MLTVHKTYHPGKRIILKKWYGLKCISKKEALDHDTIPLMNPE